MRYALVGTQKLEAAKGLYGVCPSCGSGLTAKCGGLKINHWAHKGIRTCDSWWENETAWHRSWKNNFPSEWQEISLPDKLTGEKHIADIRTEKGLVVEFQRSHINPQERLAREAFYKNLTWVVDGSRLKRDYVRFIKGKEFFKAIKNSLFIVNLPERYFPSAWLQSSVPVLFDFQNVDPLSDPENKRHFLCCLFPAKIGNSVIVAEVSKDAFVNDVISGEWAVKTRQIISYITQVEKERRLQLERQKRREELWRFQTYSIPRGKRF